MFDASERIDFLRGKFLSFLKFIQRDSGLLPQFVQATVSGDRCNPSNGRGTAAVKPGRLCPNLNIDFLNNFLGKIAPFEK